MVVVIAGADVQEAVGAETDASAAVGTRATDGVGPILEGDVGDQIQPFADRVPVRIQVETYNAVRAGGTARV